MAAVPFGTTQGVTITDDDDAPVLSLSVSSASIAEGGGTSTVTVSTDSGSTFPTDRPITLRLEDGTTAVLNDDFTMATTLTLPAGVGTSASSIATTIAALDDDIYEGTTDETIVVRGLVGGSTFGAARTVTITDNTAGPKLTLTLTDDSISENGGSTTVTARVAPRTVDAFTVDFSVSPDAPATSADYTLAGTLSFDALSATSTGGTVSITAHDNRVDRPDKTVRVTGVSSRTYFRATDAVTLTIEDEDAAPAPVVRVAGSPMAENAGEATVEVSTGDGSTYPTAQTVVLTLTGTAVEDADYSIDSKTLTLPAGSGLAVSSVSTTVTGIDDIIDDDGDTVLVDAAIGAAAIGSRQTIAIADDDVAPTVTVGVSPGSISENGASATVTVTTDTGSSTFATDRTVTLTLSGTAVEDADYSIVAKTLTLPAGVGNDHASVDTSITGLNDAIDESDTETVLIDAAIGATAVGTRQTLRLEDDDDAPALVFSASAAQIAEAGGTSTLTVSTGTGSTFETDQTIALTVTDVTATLNSDYSVSDTTLTLPAGMGLAPSMVTSTVTGLEDGFYEGQTDQTLTVSAARGADTIGDPITLRIADNEAPSKPVITVDPARIDEGGTSDIAATVSPPADATFWLRVRFAGDLGRYTFLTEPGLTGGPFNEFTYIEFPAGATASAPRRLRVSAHTNEADDGDSQVVLSGGPIGFRMGTGELANPVPGILSADPVTITIRDDDEGPTTVTLSTDVAEVDEDAGATVVRVTGTLSGEARTSATAVTVSVGTGTTGTDAVAGTDFAEVADFELNIAEGQTSGSATFTLTPTDDIIDEPNESLRVSGTSTDSTVGVTATAIDIVDDDEAPSLELSVDAASIDEAGGEAVVTVSTGTGSTYAAAQVLTLQLTGTATQGSDYTVGSTTLTLPAGMGTEASRIATAIAAVDDDIAEPEETVIVSGLLDGAAFGEARTVSIADNDGTPAVTLVLTPPSVFEGGTSTVTATVSPASSEAFEVTVSAAAVAPADAGDFTLSGTTLSFAPDAAQSTGTVSIAATDDTLDNPDRTVTVSGAVTTEAVTAPADVALTIVDDDGAATLTLDVAPDVIAEAGGAATVTVSTVGGSTFATDQPIVLSLGGTAVLNEDYTLGDATPTLAAGTTSVSTALTGLADGVFEGNETVTVSGLVGGVAFGAEQTVALIDGNAAPIVALVLTPDAISENAGVQAP